MTIKILVVDDASFIRDMVKRNLRDKIPDVEVFDAADGHRACALLKGQAVDLILSDWEMPSMSGEEFLHWIRNHERYAKIPFIMVTSRGDREFVIKAIEAGVSDYISKPFTPEELIRKTLKQLHKLGLAKSSATANKGTTQGMAGTSVDVLTGGAPVQQATQSKDSTNQLGAETISALTRSVAAPTLAADKSSIDKIKPTNAKPVKKAKGQAQLRFANNQCCTCVVREMSLQALNGLMQRGDVLPTVFDQAVVDIASDDGDSIARINGYVHSISAAENKIDANIVKIVIRFVDNDAEKFEILSKYIAKL